MYKIPEPHPNLSRNGFDLSSRRIFSAPAGALLPVLTLECNPGEKFRISVNDLVRAQPLNTAAFARCKEYYHFFFVPYNSLWRYFDQFITGTNDGYSSYGVVKPTGDSKISADSVPNYVPRFDYGKLLQVLRGFEKEKAPTPPSDPGKKKKFDSMGFSYASGAWRLLNLLGYGCTGDGKFFSPQGLKSSQVAYVQGDFDNITLTPSIFRALAYQRIYNDFYRNQQWESADTLSFNLDYAYYDTLCILDGFQAAKAFQLRYRQLPKDFVTSSLPSAVYDSSIFSLPTVLNRSGEVRSTGAGVSVSSSVTVTPSSSSGSVVVSTSDIRSAFALEKMLEATRRANGLDYSSQISAHYGFDVPDSRRPRAKFLGGFDNSIAISEVVSTSAGSAIDSSGKPVTSSATGQVFGKGLGYMNSGDIEFLAPEHGILMCIYSVVPQLDYNANFLDPFNRKLKREDFFQPEFQDLGMVPVLASDICMQSGFGDGDDLKRLNNVLAFNLRYSEYKQSRDLVFGEFMSGLSLSAWSTPKVEPFAIEESASGSHLSSAPKFTPASFKVSPSMLDPIFAVNYDGTDKTDQFLVNSYFDVKAVRPMSVTGLPKL